MTWALADDALLDGFGTGDPQAAAAFIRRHQARVYGLAQSIVLDSALAEDVAQEAFTRAWRHAATYDPRRGTVPTWLLTITRNLAIDALRLRRSVPMDPTVLAALDLRTTSTEAEPGRAAELAEHADRLRSALADLPGPQRRALIMAGICGRTAKEVSESEGIPLGTAKTRIRAGMRKLRLVLVDIDQEGPEPHADDVHGFEQASEQPSGGEPAVESPPASGPGQPAVEGPPGRRGPGVPPPASPPPPPPPQAPSPPPAPTDEASSVQGLRSQAPTAPRPPRAADDRRPQIPNGQQNNMHHNYCLQIVDQHGHQPRRAAREVSEP
jgi:RNA polymerase sigma-70 factor (ECF subfamily)